MFSCVSVMFQLYLAVSAETIFLSLVVVMYFIFLVKSRQKITNFSAVASTLIYVVVVYQRVGP